MSFTTARSVADGTLKRAGLALSHVRGRDWLRLPERDTHDAPVKPAPYLPIYEQLLASLRLRRCAILELGVWKGDSLVMWRNGFRRATIVGLDAMPSQIELGKRVHIFQGDQTDAELMRQIRDTHAPGGFDVIIDDASHIGITTARSLQILFAECLQPGGIYIIEDWGTGYLPDFYDGGRVTEPVAAAALDRSPVSMVPDIAAPIPLPSHDLGMVGVVKRLVDHVARGTLAHFTPGSVDEPLPIASMEVFDGMVVLRKAS